MKHCLVTGADGFIGSHLVESLVKEGHKVRALAQYNSFNHWGWLDSVSCLNEIEVKTGDIRDPFFCDEITKGIDTVFHLAALIAIPYSYVAPQSYVDTNICGTVNMCKAAMDNGVKRFIHTSTSEIYGTALYVPIDEKHPPHPQSPYSASKIAADALALSFHHSFNFPLVIARPFNTYGPRQSARAVIPTIISQIAAGRTEIELGDTTPTRDFNFVEDTCRGLRALAQNPDVVGKALNIGSDSEISIGDLFDLIRKKMKSSAKLVRDEQRIRPPNSEVQRLRCDNTLIRKLTGYTPQVSLEEGLERTIDWFTNPENLKKYKPGIYNV